MTRNRCYFCGNAGKADALYDHVCLRHFLIQSWQLALLQLRRGQFPSRLFWRLFFQDLCKRIGRRS